MTRINVIDPVLLCNKHLVAEYRELPRISKLAKQVQDAPVDYVLGTGHCKFFYDKGKFLQNRFEKQIVPEMIKRGFVCNFRNYREHPGNLHKDWIPTEKAKFLNLKRINERLLAMRKK